MNRISNDYKVLIESPHEIREIQGDWFKKLISGLSVSYCSQDVNTSTDIMILDTFGILKYAYDYADVVYIGGGFGKGIHNVVEAAIYKKPIIIGPNNAKFESALELLKLGLIQVCTDSDSFQNTIIKMLDSDSQMTEDKFAFCWKNRSNHSNKIAKHIMDLIK